MSVTIRPMRSEDADAVATLVHGLARDTRPGIIPKLTGAALVANADLIDVVIAEERGRVIGACLGLLTFSTWRGAKGLYVVDLFVDGEARNRGIGLELLKESARRARTKGALFIKLEVDHVNDGAARFYERLGFVRHDEDRLFVLEEDGMARLWRT
jgi:ribosomal protein S18 acetylase RimI-like enzyme